MSPTNERNLRPFITPFIGAAAGINYGLMARYVIGRIDDNYVPLGFCFLALTPPLLGMITVALATTEQKETHTYVIMMPWVAAIVCSGLALTFAYEFLFFICVIAPYTLITSSLGGLTAKQIWRGSQSSGGGVEG